MSPWVDLLTKVGWPTAVTFFLLWAMRWVLRTAGPKVKDWVEAWIADQRKAKEAAEVRAEIAIAAQLALQQKQSADFAQVLERYNNTNEATARELAKLAETSGVTVRQIVEMTTHVKSLADSVKELISKPESRPAKTRQSSGHD